MRRTHRVEAAAGWDGRGGADAGGGAGAADADAVVGEGAAWHGKVRRSSTADKPTAALVGVADMKADVTQPLDPRAKVGAGVVHIEGRRNGCR
jgi:hypothetical protein